MRYLKKVFLKEYTLFKGKFVYIICSIGEVLRPIAEEIQMIFDTVHHRLLDITIVDIVSEPVKSEKSVNTSGTAIMVDAVTDSNLFFTCPELLEKVTARGWVIDKKIWRTH